MVCYSWPKRYYTVVRSSAGFDASSDLHSLCDRDAVAMSLIDFLETWWLSIQPLFESVGVIGRFERSPVDRPNPSCALNLRRKESETDLLLWESGEAELATVDH